MPDVLAMRQWTVRTVRRVVEESGPATLGITQWTVRTARLMVGVPDYDTYVQHRRANHPDQAIMTYEEFFIERQEARYSVGKGRFRGCC